jgi:hypothetical protein
MAACKDAKGVDRAQVHREVANMAYTFFQATAASPTQGPSTAVR